MEKEKELNNILDELEWGGETIALDVITLAENLVARAKERGINEKYVISYLKQNPGSISLSNDEKEILFDYLKLRENEQIKEDPAFFYLTDFYKKYKDDKIILLSAVSALGKDFEYIVNEIRNRDKKQSLSTMPTL
ncbi:hypothetical protein [Caminibacter pacificus]|uniref:Uncharacterized protein n=1 Tax=Caminibacter pacificus TaxID=1424653 RepID=A0AAJ4RBB9_9BACT|nr:hypothetical protein [Caminibacter pacificus]QDD68204.1 hypothetical protein C6V80_10135 [Caminibacter pacificus]ROR38717.1 hypothetical protein EDC58_1932 [Caminibacter pacificus]